MIDNYKRKKVKPNKFSKLEKELNKHGYRKVFDTIKYDHHWYKDGMTTRVQMLKIGYAILIKIVLIVVKGILINIQII